MHVKRRYSFGSKKHHLIAQPSLNFNIDDTHIAFSKMIKNLEV